MQDILFLVHRLNFISFLDIFLVTLTFYAVLRLFQGTQAVQLLRGLLLLILLIVVLTNVFDLTAFRWLVQASLPAFLVAVPVIFQPELRRALGRLGQSTPLFGRELRPSQTAQLVEELVSATFALAKQRFGALIVIEGVTGLEEYIETGTLLNAKVSRELIMSLFYPNSALHDGAIIIRREVIVAAGCVLPLSQSVMDSSLGTRHRAGVGVSEQSDAFVVIVSEETGIVSVARNGHITRRLEEGRLRKALYAFFGQETGKESEVAHD